jgi:hypothetical protein
VPWNPIGAIIGPLAVFSLVARRRKANPYLLVLLMLVVLPLSVGMACNLFGPTPSTSAPIAPATPVTATALPPATATNVIPFATQAPTETPEPCVNCGAPTPTLDPTSLPLPDINEIPDPEGRAPLVGQATLEAYKSIRSRLWKQCSSTCVDPVTGMIGDAYFVALIIIEFGNFKDTLDHNVYLEGVEAVSNEYYSAADLAYYTTTGNMLCRGKCTINTQLSWMYDIEFFRKVDFLRLVDQREYEKYLYHANLAIAPGGFSHGPADLSWHWGNVARAELKNFCIEAQTSNQDYEGYDVFIVYSCKN